MASACGKTNSVAEIGSISSGLGREAILKSKCPSARLTMAGLAFLLCPMAYWPVSGSSTSGVSGDDLPPGRIIGRRCRAIGQLAQPDVAESDLMPVVLKLDRAAIDAVIIRRRLEPVGSTPELFVILNENSVVDDREPGRLEQLAVVIEPGTAKGDVIGLPLARGPRRVGERRILAVKGAGLAVGVGVGMVRVDDLNFKLPMRKMPLLPRSCPLPTAGLGEAHSTCS